MPHRKCSFPGQHLISADIVLYKDDEVVGPITQSVIESAGQVQRVTIELRYKLHVTVNRLVFVPLKLVVLHIKTTNRSTNIIHETNFRGGSTIQSVILVKTFEQLFLVTFPALSITTLKFQGPTISLDPFSTLSTHLYQ